MTCYDWPSSQWEVFTDNVCLCKVSFSPFRLFLPLRRCPFFMQGLLRKSCTPGLPFFSPFLRKGGMGVGGLGMPLCCFPRVFLSSRSTLVQREGWGASGRSFGARELASVSSVHSWTGDTGVALLRRTPATRSVPVGSPSSSLHALRGDGTGESSGDFSVLSCLSRLISARSARW